VALAEIYFNAFGHFYFEEVLVDLTAAIAAAGWFAGFRSRFQQNWSRRKNEVNYVWTICSDHRFIGHCAGF
jgi:hypothetical protein